MAWTVARSLSAAMAVSAAPISTISAANSSPPIRATTSQPRRLEVIVWATARSSASPASWPNPSLICFRLSTSTAQMAKRLRGMVASSRSNSRRLRSPVRGSVAATSASRAMVSRSAASARRRPSTCPACLPKSIMISTAAGLTAGMEAPNRPMTPTTASSESSGNPTPAVIPMAAAAPPSWRSAMRARSATITGADVAQTRPGRSAPSLTSRSQRA